ncbi:MAG: hypothetical protein KKB51_04600 [Candidatus Riflebacteria bacterium]|nr:hypothetical protein [Candidatus Riflebacteria bacterium]
MQSFTRRSLSAIVLLAMVFSFFSGILHANSKHDMFETSEKIARLKAEIRAAHEELRRLNEEGGEQAQEQAQVLMAQIKELKAELKVLEQSLDSMKKGGSKLRSDKVDPRYRR